MQICQTYKEKLKKVKENSTEMTTDWDHLVCLEYIFTKTTFLRTGDCFRNRSSVNLFSQNYLKYKLYLDYIYNISKTL